jgi:2-polyprenyl-6-methoxyphenol hydroxylase-like FAD-dependent oxidoreductase
VDVVLDKNGQEEKARYQYVCGADGAHSSVRKLLGIPFEGSAYNEHFSLADLQVKWQYDHDKVLLWSTPHFMLVAFPLPEQSLGGPNYYRFVVDEFEVPTNCKEVYCEF